MKKKRLIIYMLNVCLHEIIFLPLKQILKQCFMVCAALALAALPVQSSKGSGVCTPALQQEGLPRNMERGNQGRAGGWDFLRLYTACLGTGAVTHPQG